MLYHRLRELDQRGTPIQIGLIAAGTFGTQIASQLACAPGMRLAAIAELDLAKARRAYGRGQIPDDQIDTADDPAAIDAAMEAGRYAVTGDARALMESGLDLVIEATGNVEAGAAHARYAIAQKKHLVMVTVEADVVVGSQLKKLADETGVLYSAAYGDEPACALELWDWARALGFRVIAAGKGTRFKTAFRKANPDDVPRLYGFTGRDYNAQMFGSFLDGTKHAIEMACLANMSGLVPDVRGMHFPRLTCARSPTFCAIRARVACSTRKAWSRRSVSSTRTSRLSSAVCAAACTASSMEPRPLPWNRSARTAKSSA